MSEFLKAGLVAVPWMIMGLVVGFDLGRAFERSVRASARSRRMNDNATEAPAPTPPRAEPAPGADAQSDSQRKDCAGDGNVGFGGHANSVAQKQEAGK